jgi:hypothetical protein
LQHDGLVAVALAPLAWASVLSNGNSVPVSPLLPTGTLMATQTGTMTTPTFSADYAKWVYSDPANTWCSGCLDLVYQFTNHRPDVNAPYYMFNFASVLVDVGTNPFGVHDPTLVDSSLNGSVVGISFPASDEFVPGQTTRQLVIETDALQ